MYRKKSTLLQHKHTMVFNILELFKSEFFCSHYNKEHAILNAVFAMILAIKLKDNMAGIT